MAETQTGNGGECCIFPCPLCGAPKTSIGHLTEHLKKFHRPFAELGPSSKRDDRLRLSSKQKEELTEAVPKNRYKSMEQKYSLIVNIAAPRSPLVADSVPTPPGEEDVKSPTLVLQSWNFQQYLHNDVDDTLDVMTALGGRDKELMQHCEDKSLTLPTIVAANVESATRTESPRHPTSALTVSRPAPSYLALMPDPLIGGVAYEAPFSSPSSSDQNFVVPDSAGEWQPPEWLDYEEQD